ncbi:hypothetical protein EDB19DRAFT_1834583 [Suillus lakei]|nr:hypothetical protein EDB19DRAFT_1834583 [Suillus lakei]
MNNNNTNAHANGGIENQNYEIPLHLLQHTPRPQEVTFRMTRRQLVRVRWTAEGDNVPIEAGQPMWAHGNKCTMIDEWAGGCMCSTTETSGPRDWVQYGIRYRQSILTGDEWAKGWGNGQGYLVHAEYTNRRRVGQGMGENMRWARVSGTCRVY